MGQEIVHCSVCGVRLRSSDFEKGEALRVDYTAYCRACSGRAAPSKSGAPPSSTTKKRKSSTSHIPIVTPRRAMESVPSKPFPSAVLWGGGALLVALIVAAAVPLLSRPGHRDPEPVSRQPAPPPAPKTPPPPAPAAPRPGAPPAPAASNESAELATLDQKVAEITAQELFKEAFDLLANARSRHDTLEWTAAVRSRTNDLENRVKALYLDLQSRRADARRQGAAAEEKAIGVRIARWGLPAYPVEMPAAAAPEASVPAPAPAPTPAPPEPPVTATAPPPAVVAPEQPASIPFTAGPMKWSLLVPKRVSSSAGSVLTVLEDGSILAGGQNPASERYTVAVRTDLKGITAFRLEVLPHPSFFGSGPGRAENGNFVLSEFKVQAAPDPSAASGTPIAIERASTDHSQDQWTISHALDGRNDTGWAILPRVGRIGEAVFELKAPASSGTFLFLLEQQSACEKHQIGRFRLSASTTKNASLEFSLRPPPVIDPSRVDQAIQRGIAWLRTAPYPENYWMGPNELILWTFVHAGVPESDPDFQKRLKEMLDAPLEKTYRVALQAMILEELDRVGYQHRLWQCAQFLVDNQCPNGQWLYGEPVELPKGVPTPAKAPVPTVARIDAEGRRIKPKVVRKMKATKTRDGPPEGDNSNSQYAALGLRACFDAGVLVPEDTILRAIKWWRESQYFDEAKDVDGPAKGWSYTSAAKEPRASHAMTVGGISSLIIYDYILGRDWKKNTTIKAGSNWIAQFWTINSNYYYLYGLERAGVLYGNEKFGRFPWYPLGARFILESQDSAGNWPGAGEKPEDVTAWNCWNTCFAILFLKHATRPLVASEDKFNPR